MVLPQGITWAQKDGFVPRARMKAHFKKRE